MQVFVSVTLDIRVKDGNGYRGRDHDVATWRNTRDVFAFYF